MLLSTAFFTFVSQTHISPLVLKVRAESARRDEHGLGKVSMCGYLSC